MVLFYAFWSPAEFSISNYYFVRFCHSIEWQANMLFLFVYMSFSRMEPTLLKQQYFLKFDFYHIKKPFFFKKWVFLPFSRMAGSSFLCLWHLLECSQGFQILKQSQFLQAAMCSIQCILLFNIMERIFPIRVSSVLCLYHSRKCCKDIETNLFFFFVVLSFRRMLHVFQAGVSLQESNDLRWFLKQFIEWENWG